MASSSPTRRFKHYPLLCDCEQCRTGELCDDARRILRLDCRHTSTYIVGGVKELGDFTPPRRICYDCGKVVP